ncbi:hypothetical protein AB1Y20_018029 [Prymnesium parvum]|uniref:Battenin n=1 Tax=Prymnesium parvum TaxID=97485 RepID=A0AB34JNA4_PRYPA
MAEGREATGAAAEGKAEEFLLDAVQRELPLPSSPTLTARATFCGVVNNASFCVLLGASQEIAKEFSQKSFQPLIVNISTAGSVIGVFFSSRVMVGRMGDFSRLSFVTIGNLIGYFMIGLAYRVSPWYRTPQEEESSLPAEWGFWLCTLGAFILGFVQSVGEVMNLALYRSFSPGMLGSWGAGTGLAGIVGPFMFILLHDALGLDVGEIAFVLIGMAPLYFLAFWSIIKHRNARTQRPLLLRAIAPEGSPAETCDNESAANVEVKEGSVSFTVKNLVVVWKFCYVVLINMVAVYALEYMITSGFLQTVTACAPTSSWMANSDNNNPLLWAMYNVGVTLSRSSVSCFRIQRIWILTLLQALNVLVWGLFASTQWIAHWHSDTPLYIAAVHMVWVGFMGGACYSNCMYLFNTSRNIPDKYRELGINMGFFFSNIGIISATGFVTVLKSTVLSQSTLFPPDGNCTMVQTSISDADF